MRIRFWGVRGSIPAPGKDTCEYGGNTACLDILTSDNQLIIIDAGTGIRRLGQRLEKEYPKRIVGSILISHTHWDHIQGFPFFTPVLNRNNRFVLVGPKRVDQRLEEILAGQFVEPYLPFAYKTLPADIIVKEVHSGETLVIGETTTVQVARLKHPGGSLGFRIEDNGLVFTYCSDTGHHIDSFDKGVMQLAEGADLLVHDAHFPTQEEAHAFLDWGHSSWYDAVQVALEARVRHLGLFHYSPDLTDDMLDRIGEQARAIFPRTLLAKDGMTITLPSMTTTLD